MADGHTRCGILAQKEVFFYEQVASRITNEKVGTRLAEDGSFV